MDFAFFLEKHCHRLENFLDTILDPQLASHKTPSRLLEAIRYCVLNKGKRVRPLLVYATGDAFGTPVENLDAPAAAVELIHCYSLIHDDLPAMDNDDLRRGKPTCHKAFDEATAILAGDALQTLAFQTLSDPQYNSLTAEQKIRMVQVLASHSGHTGMVEGQALDIALKESTTALSPELLQTIYQKKTGALIEASVMLGALAHPQFLTETHLLTNLQEFARCIGLAFQIQDDILDIVSQTKILGKTAGKDQKQNKPTFPSLVGLTMAKQYTEALQQQALKAIEPFQEKGFYLNKLSHFLINRNK